MRGCGGGEEAGRGLWALWGPGVVLGGWASAALQAASQLRMAGPFQGNFYEQTFFFLRVPGPSWTPGVRDIHAGLRQRGSRQEGAGGALAPPRGEVSSSAGTSVPQPPPASTSPASLPWECSALDSAMGLTELS